MVTGDIGKSVSELHELLQLSSGQVLKLLTGDILAELGVVASIHDAVLLYTL